MSRKAKKDRTVFSDADFASCTMVMKPATNSRLVGFAIREIVFGKI